MYLSQKLSAAILFHASISLLAGEKILHSMRELYLELMLCITAAVLREKIELLKKHVDIIEGEAATEAMDTSWYIHR